MQGMVPSVELKSKAPLVNASVYEENCFLFFIL